MEMPLQTGNASPLHRGLGLRNKTVKLLTAHVCIRHAIFTANCRVLATLNFKRMCLKFKVARTPQFAVWVVPYAYGTKYTYGMEHTYILLIARNFTANCGALATSNFNALRTEETINL